MSNQGQGIAASAYLAALERCRVDHFVTVPDWVQLALHERVERGVDGLRLVRCSNEDQAVCVSAGLHIAGKRPVTVIQNQGLYACVNAIRAVCLDARIPLVFMVGHFGREFGNFGKDPNQSRRNTVRLLDPVLSAIGVRSWLLEQPGDLPGIEDAFAYAASEGRCAALIVGTPIAQS